MVQQVNDDVLRAAIRRSRVEVGGLLTDPWAVVVSTGTPAEQEATQLALIIGRVFLEREIEQWSIMSHGDLRKVVEASLVENAARAMYAYLCMIRGDYRPEEIARKAGLRRLRWFRPAHPRWLWQAWDKVSLSEDGQNLIIAGTCVPWAAQGALALPGNLIRNGD